MSTAVATYATGLFAGAALYITLVEHPARLASGAAVAVAQFRPSYRRATALQAPLAVIASLAAVIAWSGGAGGGWLVIAAAMAGIVVFTLVVVYPTNARLLDQNLDVGSPAALALLQRWGTLHAVRTCASLAAFGLELALAT